LHILFRKGPSNAARNFINKWLTQLTARHLEECPTIPLEGIKDFTIISPIFLKIKTIVIISPSKTLIYNKTQYNN
jgi:hypothetical protein